MKNLQLLSMRSAGVLLPVSSLPSPYGIGTFGKDAYMWVDFLRKAKQRFWQILPLGPTGFGDSPYQSFSAFAGNPYYIDLEILCKDGLLYYSEIQQYKWGSLAEKIDYGLLFQHRESILRKAFSRFNGESLLEEFKKSNADWLDDYALYMTIKSTLSFKPWLEWDKDIALRNTSTLEKIKREAKSEIDYHCFVQYQFFKQWTALRQYANRNGIYIIGDIPIYVALDSADVWGHASLFQLGSNMFPIEVSGCPPDAFTPDGQLWGNPLYNWELMHKTDYSWWVQRTRANFRLYDVLRIDHFRGIESYYAIPWGSITAHSGYWRDGPRMNFVRAIQKNIPGAQIIVEDLGFPTDGVQKLVRESGFPGMKVLPFAFRPENLSCDPRNYSFNNVVYTGTHDSDTVLGWARDPSSEDVDLMMEYVGVHNKDDLPLALINLAMSTNCAVSIIPIQDWLGLGSEGRINTPATTGGNNWCWRVRRDDITAQLNRRMKRITELYDR
jgi:4-alpha-glucanotransferase